MKTMIAALLVTMPGSALAQDPAVEWPRAASLAGLGIGVTAWGRPEASPVNPSSNAADSTPTLLLAAGFNPGLDASTAALQIAGPLFGNIRGSLGFAQKSLDNLIEDPAAPQVSMYDSHLRFTISRIVGPAALGLGVTGSEITVIDTRGHSWSADAGGMLMLEDWLGVGAVVRMYPSGIRWRSQGERWRTAAPYEAAAGIAMRFSPGDMLIGFVVDARGQPRYGVFDRSAGIRAAWRAVEGHAAISVHGDASPTWIFAVVVQAGNVSLGLAQEHHEVTGSAINVSLLLR